MGRPICEGVTTSVEVASGVHVVACDAEWSASDPVLAFEAIDPAIGAQLFGMGFGVVAVAFCIGRGFKLVLDMLR